MARVHQTIEGARNMLIDLEASVERLYESIEDNERPIDPRIPHRINEAAKQIGWAEKEIAEANR